jgi:hypothetical protein
MERRLRPPQAAHFQPEVYLHQGQMLPNSYCMRLYQMACQIGYKNGWLLPEKY